MKKLYKLSLIGLLLFNSLNINAQDETNPWAFSFGINAVDFFPTGQDEPLGEFFDEIFNLTDHFNVLPTLSNLSISRYINNNITVGINGSYNVIDRFGEQRVDDLTYIAVDLFGKYDFSSFFKSKSIGLEPYSGLGFGLTFIDGFAAGPELIGNLTLNGLAGLTWWWSSHFGINIESKYKASIDDDRVSSHLQHSVGLIYKFGGSSTDDDEI